MTVRRALLVVVAAVALVATVDGAAAPGDLDPTWGQGGVVRTVLARYPEGSAIVWRARLQRSRLTLSGSYSEAPANFAVRYTAAGTLDTSFGRNGILKDGWHDNRVVPNWELRRIMALSLPDGRFITAGTSLRRHLRDGRIDPSFRPGRLGAGRCRYFLDPVLRQPDGRVIAVARQWCGDDDPGVWTLLRFLRNGARDRTFGVGGVSRIAVGISALGSYSGVGKVILLPSGRLVLGGATAVEGGTPTEPDYAFAVARLDAHGRLDGSFGAGGVVRVPVEKGFASFGDLLRRPDGRLLLVGCVPWSQSDSTEVVGLRGDGSLDASWASGGIGTYGGAFPATDLHCGWLAQRPDGGIFVLLNGRLAALTTDGTLDAAFGDEGVVPTRTDDVLLLESGRRVVVAGGVDLPGQQRGVAVFRYRY